MTGRIDSHFLCLSTSVPNLTRPTHSSTFEFTMDQPSLSDDLSLGCSRWDTFAHSLADSSAEGDSWLRDFIDLNSDSAPHPCRPRGTHARLPRCAVKVLEGWLAEHRQHPYASRAEQDELATQTDLDRRQIRSWLSNARKRRKESLAEAEPPVLFPPHLHPFERWLYSDLEYDGTNPTALHQAIINQREGRAPNTFMVDDLPYGTGLRWGPARADSVTSIEIRSYAANEESVASADWKDTELRKPVRRQSKKAPPKSQMPSKPVRLFQCTFCGRSFSKNHDWQRHEKSQHLPLDRWICCCEGSEYVDPATNRASCVFCDAYDPSVEHMSQHGYTRCVNRPLEERTFFRKDHLSQHLRLLHGCQFMPAMEQWRTVTTELQSRCGFCTEIFSTWAERVVHLAEHFKGGSTMQDWRGNWGFDEPIEQVVERATLPEERSHCPRLVISYSVLCLLLMTNQEVMMPASSTQTNGKRPRRV